MPFICKVCGDEVSYDEPVFKLRNNAEIVICTNCINKELRTMKKETIIKKITIEYCDANEKYDSFIDGEWTGKWYTLEECLKATLKEVKTKWKEQNWNVIK